MEELKECRRCFKKRPRSEFHRSDRHKDGLQTWCKQCINEYKTEWRTKRRNPEDQAFLDHTRENQGLVKDGLKRCRKCQEIKSLDEFFAGEGTGNKFGQCAVCRQSWDRESGKRTQRYRDESPEYRKAVKTVFDAIGRGDIVRPETCSLCGHRPKKRVAVRIQFHHTDGYDKAHWYFGIFVCARCHSAIHRGKVKVEGTDYDPYA